MPTIVTVGKYAMSTDSNIATESKIKVRRDFKIRLTSNLKRRISHPLLF